MSTATHFNDFAVWELEAFAEGVDMPHVATFIQQHPDEWMRWLYQYHRTGQSYVALRRADCPSPDELRDYHWDDLSSVDHQRIKGHLEICPSCSEEFKSLTSSVVVQTTEPQQLASTQRNLSEYLHEFTGHLQSVMATLVMPLTPQMALAGLRNNSVSTPESEWPSTLVFEADDIDISLVVQKGTDEYISLVGQVLSPTDISGCKVKITPANTEVEERQVFLDDIGSFKVNRLRHGYHRFVFLLPDKSVIIPSVMV